MKTILKDGHYYSANRQLNGDKVYFEVSGITHFGKYTDSVFLIFPPKDKGGTNRGIYHWPNLHYNIYANYIKESTAQELTKEELLHIILETRWKTSSEIFGISNLHGEIA